MRLAVLLATVMTGVGCFNPNPASNLPCSEEGECPGGQACDDATKTCVPTRGGEIDAATTDGTADAADECEERFPYALSNVHRCSLPEQPIGPLTITASQTLNTDTGELGEVALAHIVVPQADGPDLYVLFARSLTLRAPLTVTGSRPLVVVTAEAITIESNGVLTANAAGTNSGPGGGGCAGTAAPDTTIPGRGGSGGSFGGVGGVGGGTSNLPEIMAPSASTITTLSPLAGGCIGGKGGGTSIAAGGGGGGAIQLSAGTTLAILGSIEAHADGGSGGGSAILAQLRSRPSLLSRLAAPSLLATDGTCNSSIPGSGGAGGGSGGAILLEGDTVTVDGAVLSFGGGGGGGGYDDCGAGTAGMGSVGGSANNMVLGPKGGDGATAADSPNGMPGQSSPASGAGGGGGLGITHIRAASGAAPTFGGSVVLVPTPTIVAD